MRINSLFLAFIVLICFCAELTSGATIAPDNEEFAELVKRLESFLQQFDVSTLLRELFLFNNTNAEIIDGTQSTELGDEADDNATAQATELDAVERKPRTLSLLLIVDYILANFIANRNANANANVPVAPNANVNVPAVPPNANVQIRPNQV